MLNHLNTVEYEFEFNYALSDLKQELFSWCLQNEIEKIRQQIKQKGSFGVKDYQRSIKDLFATTHDVHSSVDFYSTEYAALPFLVQGVNDRYFVVWCNDLYLQTKGVSIHCGDEIISFDDIPVKEIVDQILKDSFSGYATETFQRLSELQLTLREGGANEKVPQGRVKVCYKKNDHLQTAYLNWLYIPEKVTLNHQMPLTTLNKKYPIQVKNRLLHSYQKAVNFGNCYATKIIGAKKNIFPPIDDKIWESSSENFDAYIFKNNWKKVGYVRIPDFDGNIDLVSEFEEIIRHMRKNTTTLIVDVMNNPGGYGFYTFALLSMLTPKPLKNVSERNLITQKDAFTAVNDIKYFEKVKTEAQAQDLLGVEICGYVVDEKLAKGICDRSKFVLKEYNNKHYFTDPYPLEGVDFIYPHKRVNYDKNLIVLVNALSISCADIFPAVLQDNKRAIIVGTATAGAGGCTISKSIANRYGIAEMHFTNSMIYRSDGSYLENRGVTPDIVYSFTEDDYKNNYRNFLNFIKVIVSD